MRGTRAAEAIVAADLTPPEKGVLSVRAPPAGRKVKHKMKREEAEKVGGDGVGSH